MDHWSRAVDLSKPALVCERGESVAFGQLLDLMSEASTRPRVTAIVFSPSVEAVVAYLRSVAEPGPTILLDHKIAPASLREIVTRFHVEFVEGPPLALQSAGFSITPKGQRWSTTHVRMRQNSNVLEDASSTVLLGTSGSTGNRKFVRLASNSLLTNAADIQARLEISAEDVAATILPPSYSYGLSVVNSILLAGGTILASELNPLQKDFRERVQASRVSHLPGVPSLYAIYERMGIISDPPSSVTTFTQAGGKLAATKVREYARDLKAKRVRFFPMYGQTEATARMSILDSALALEYPDSVGSPVPSGRFSIGSPDNDDEIMFTGPNVMLGYAEAAGDSFEVDDLDGVLATGDLGHLKEGLLYITGRAKRIVKLSGVRVNLDELETMLEKVCECAAISFDDHIFVFVVPRRKETSRLVEALLAKFGFSRLSFSVVEVEDLFYNSSGKKDYPRFDRMIGS